MLLGQFSELLNTDRGLNTLMLMAFPVSVPVGPPYLGVTETGSTSELEDQPFADSAMGNSMDSDLLPELSGETWVAATHLDEATSDLPPSDSEPDLIAFFSD